MVANGAETVGGGDFPNKDRDLLLWSQGSGDVNVMEFIVRCHLDDNINESCLAHPEVLQPLLTIPCDQNDPLPPVASGHVSPELLDLHEVVPKEVVWSWSGGSVKVPQRPWCPGWPHPLWPCKSH